MSYTLRQIALLVLKVYQKFLTLFSYASCRYYPTCSEYAKWQILNNNFLKACFFTLLRILRCNQFFAGGIDYPVVKKNFYCPFVAAKRPFSDKILFWFVPKTDKSFYVIKAFSSSLKGLS